MDCNPPSSSVCGVSPGNQTWMGCHPLLQGIFPTQGSNLGLQHCRGILYRLNQGSPRILEWIAHPFFRGSSQPRNQTRSLPGLAWSTVIGNGTSFQYSCLESSLGRGAWQAIVHMAAKSWTGLSTWYSTACQEKQIPSQTKTTAI